MNRIIDHTRRPDITFWQSGKIDISAGLARTLGLESGHVINIVQQDKEYYVYVAQRPPYIGRHEATVKRTNRRGHHFRLNCRISYDYVNQRIILFSSDPDIGYAYIYSLKSQLWGMMLTDATNAVPSYPEALATTADGRLLNFSQRTLGATPVIAVTRPFTVDGSDGLSSVDTIIQRGTFARGHVAQALYGSRDLANWFYIWSSSSERLQGMHGTPYKYFRLAILAHLSPTESLSAATISHTPRLRNRPR